MTALLTDPARLKLMTDAVSVLDWMDTQRGGAPDLTPEARRAQLLAVVTDACQREGRSYSAAEIEQAVSQWLAQQPLACVTSPRPSFWSRLTQTMRTLRQGGIDWWETCSGRTQMLAKCIPLSVAGALALVFTPWWSLIRAPFVLAATHGTLFLVLLLAALGVAIAGAIYSDQENDEGLEALSYLSIAVLLMVGVVGGGCAHLSAHSTSDAVDLRHGFTVAEQALHHARTQLKPGASLSDVVKLANDAVLQDKSTTFRDVGDFDVDRGVIQHEANLNPAECQQFSLHPDPVFHVVSVNGQPVGSGPLACPFIWDNEVLFETSPNTF
jgi:hypothetical protein